jgi:hypothetical protein
VRYKFQLKFQHTPQSVGPHLDLSTAQKLFFSYTIGRDLKPNHPTQWDKIEQHQQNEDSDEVKLSMGSCQGWEHKKINKKQQNSQKMNILSVYLSQMLDNEKYFHPRHDTQSKHKKKTNLSKLLKYGIKE